MIFLGYVRSGKRKKWLDFGRDLDHHLEILKVQQLSSLGGGLCSPSLLVYDGVNFTTQIMIKL